MALCAGAEGEKVHEKSIDADLKAVKKGAKKMRFEQGESKKILATPALDPRFIAELSKEAKVRGVSYQVLMRMLIIGASDDEEDEVNRIGPTAD